MTRLATRRSAARKTLALVAVGAVALGLGACSDRGGSADDGKLALGISVPTLDTPFFSVLIDSATAEAKAQGGKVVQTTDAKRDSGQQVTDFRNLITAGANVIIAGVVDREAIAPALEYAASKDVPVVIIDDAPAGGPAYAIVKADNEYMGAVAADTMNELLPAGGKVLSLDGGLETTNGRDRANGFKSKVKEENYPFDIISQTANWDGPESGNVAQTVLSSNGDLAGIYLATDTLYYNPVSSALKSRGKLVPAGEAGHIALVAIDGGTDALEAIRRGVLDATISQPVDNYGKFGVQYLQQALDGKEMSAGATDHDSTVTELDGYFVDALPSPVVTQENVDDESLWGNAK